MRLKNLVKQTLFGVLYLGIWVGASVVAIAVTGFIWPAKQAPDLWAAVEVGLFMGCGMLFIEQAEKRGWRIFGLVGYSSQQVKEKREQLARERETILSDALKGARNE